MSDYKEYLIPDNGGYRIAVQDVGLPIAEDWIEIPEGAVKFLFSKENNNHYHFANENNQLMSLTDINYGRHDWYGNAENYMTQCKVDVLWQRDQDQDEPFLTPECTLNDQYAEIEKVRQRKKHERNSSAWDVQIGGDHYKQFQIQPMQFALENKLDAAQQNVIKYIMRHSFKNGKQDLEKAKHYIDLMIEFYYGENNNG